MENIIENLIEKRERGELSRRQLISSLTALAAAASVSAASQSAPESAFKAVGLNHIALRVTDITRSRDFYIRHLGMEIMSQSAGSCFLSCGPDFVALFRGGTPGLDHYCYSVEGYTVEGAADKLRALGIQPRTTANRIYFPDPDGITVQLAAPGFRG